MGIKDLFSLLDLECMDVSKLKFKTIAIDLSCFIHKVKYSNDCELAIDCNSKSYIYLLEKYFAYFLTNYDTIYFCFDGKTPDIKKDEFSNRRAGFGDKIHLAKNLLKSDNAKDKKRAKEMLVQTIETRSLVNGICDYFKDYKNVILVSALFEADYLLANLSISNIVECVMTEDSDLIAHGCNNIIYKYKYWENECMFYTRSCFVNNQISVNDFELFKEFCVMCGCDYFKGFYKIGPKKAFNICSSKLNFYAFIDFQYKELVDDYERALNQFKKYSRFPSPNQIQN